MCSESIGEVEREHLESPLKRRSRSIGVTKPERSSLGTLVLGPVVVGREEESGVDAAGLVVSLLDLEVVEEDRCCGGRWGRAQMVLFGLVQKGV